MNQGLFESITGHFLDQTPISGVAVKNVEPFHIVVGVPAKPVKVKPIAPEELRNALEKK